MFKDFIKSGYFSGRIEEDSEGDYIARILYLLKGKRSPTLREI